MAAHQRLTRALPDLMTPQSHLLESQFACPYPRYNIAQPHMKITHFHVVDNGFVAMCNDEAVSSNADSQPVAF
ncbi:MAG: hypothetical protein AB8B84_12910 [Granulosicoccus sp.]